MKASSKFCRFSIVLLLALTVAFSAAVGVSADTIAVTSVEAYYAYDNNEIHYIENYNTPFYFYNNTIGQYERPKFGIMLFNELEKDFTYEYQIQIDVTRPIGDSSITSDIYNYGFYPNRLISLLEENNPNVNVNVNIEGATIYINVLFNTVDDNGIYGNPYFYISLLALYTGNTTGFTVSNIIAYKIYDPGKSQFDYIYESIQNIISNQQNIIINQENNSSNLNQALQNIITNQETQNTYWQEIINYGNNYNQINQTIINNLGTAEDQLSSAEGALENKSKSLMQQASAGISKATTASQTLVTSLTTTIPKVYTFASDIIEVTPPEVQAAVLAIPLLSFAVWLIGLRR